MVFIGARGVLVTKQGIPLENPSDLHTMTMTLSFGRFQYLAQTGEVRIQQAIRKM